MTANSTKYFDSIFNQILCQKLIDSKLANTLTTNYLTTYFDNMYWTANYLANTLTTYFWSTYVLNNKYENPLLGQQIEQHIEQKIKEIDWLETYHVPPRFGPLRCSISIICCICCICNWIPSSFSSYFFLFAFLPPTPWSRFEYFH